MTEPNDPDDYEYEDDEYEDPEEEPEEDFTLFGEVDEESLAKVGVEPLPHEERTRRGLIIAAGSAYVLLLVANIGFALLLSPLDYATIGASLGTAQGVAAGVLGAAGTYYFTRK